MPTTLRELSDDNLASLGRLHFELSPEHLTCDGELPEPVWKARQVALVANLAILRASLGLTEETSGELAVYDEIERRRILIHQRRHGARF